MSKIRVIADIHGQPNNYKKIIEGADYSVQLGDFGFDYRFLGNVDDNHHKFFPDNHDNYDKCFAYPHCLGDYGNETLNGVGFYFIRGGFSIDRDYREKHYAFTGQKSWWSNEELSQKDMYSCLENYKVVKPEFVITHEAPTVLAKKIGNPEILKSFGFDSDTFATNTQLLLQECYNAYQPKLWIHGHFHLNAENTIGRTRFISLGEFAYVDIDSNLDKI